MKKAFFSIIIIAFAAAILLMGCSNAPKDENLNIANASKSEYNSGFSYTSSIVVDKEEVPAEERDFVLEKSEDYDVEYKKVKATYSYNDLCAMGADNDILYPGAIVYVCLFCCIEH